MATMEEDLEVAHIEQPDGSVMVKMELPDGRVQLKEFGAEEHKAYFPTFWSNRKKSRTEKFPDLKLNRTESTAEDSYDGDHSRTLSKTCLAGILAFSFLVSGAITLALFETIINNNSNASDHNETLTDTFSGNITNETNYSNASNETIYSNTTNATSYENASNETSYTNTTDENVTYWATNCSRGVEHVFCWDDLCDFEHIHSCQIECRFGSCDHVDVENSIVECRSDTCDSLNAKDSVVTCRDESCQSAVFKSSRVYCEIGSFCEGADFFGCSCCEGPGCPLTDSLGYPLATCDNSTDVATFCASSYLGATCKDWGNPICEDIPDPIANITDPITNITDPIANITDPIANITGPQATEPTPVFCHREDCEGTGFKDSAAICHSHSCNKGATFENSFIDCNSHSCNFFQATTSQVHCAGQSCTSSLFNQSSVTCEAKTCSRGPSDFYHEMDPYTMFYTSAVTCERGACAISDFTSCSCCDGEGCPILDLEGEYLPSCYAQDFCSTLFMGKTCAEWGNPVCR